MLKPHIISQTTYWVFSEQQKLLAPCLKALQTVLTSRTVRRHNGDVVRGFATDFKLPAVF